MKTKRNLSASISTATRLAVYRRDGYRCALCDDVRGLQIHHVMPRGRGGSDEPMNLICLCWRCHAEAHGTWMPERHKTLPATPEELIAFRMELMNDYEQQCVEYVADLYAEEGEIWYPFKAP